MDTIFINSLSFLWIFLLLDSIKSTRNNKNKQTLNNAIEQDIYFRSKEDVIRQLKT